MFSLAALLRRLVTGLAAPAATPPDPEAMCLRDWADLPIHHPPSRPNSC